MVPIISKWREVTPVLLDRTVNLEIRDKQEEELLDITWQLSQTTRNLLLNPDLVIHRGDNITIRSTRIKS